MNVFWLDEDIDRMAAYHCDKHVSKMVLETAQLLCSAWSPKFTDELPTFRIYKPTHINHPCAKWTRETDANWHLLHKIGHALHNEYQRRYCREHKSGLLMEHLAPPKYLPKGDITPPPLCMPDEYKTDNLVESYRNYYRGAKRGIASWHHSPRPYWMQDSEIGE